MSRQDISRSLRRVMRNPTVHDEDKRALQLAAEIMDGRWTPPAAHSRRAGYRCLGLVDGQWREVQWLCRAWWIGDDMVQTTDLAPLPIRKANK